MDTNKDLIVWKKGIELVKNPSNSSNSSQLVTCNS